jgi:hypothetical protein
MYIYLVYYSNICKLYLLYGRASDTGAGGAAWHVGAWHVGDTHAHTHTRTHTHTHTNTSDTGAGDAAWHGGKTRPCSVHYRVHVSPEKKILERIIQRFSSKR